MSTGHVHEEFGGGELDGDINENISVLHGCGSKINAFCHLEFAREKYKIISV